MRKFLLLLVIISLGLAAHGQKPLSDKAEISLMTSAPYEAEVFTVYGHAALRIKDPILKIDYIFNYGIFSFNKPNFIYRFTKGETDYQLGVANYQDYIIEYQMRGSDVTEQILNLTQSEKQRIWEALIENYRPENRIYRYNFFFDNCATRPAVLTEKNVDGTINYHYAPAPQTFRDMINYCTRQHPWLTFGCDLALGSPTDRTATPHEMLFLPENLKQAFANATIESPDGNSRKLVANTKVIEALDAEELEKDLWDYLTPNLFFTILFAAIILSTILEIKRKRYFRILDTILFLIAGLAGCLLFFLSFISEHPCTNPNWMIIALHPLHLVAAILFCVKKADRVVYYYHFINFAALSLMLAGWIFIPQHLNTAFIPLVATLWIRSGWGIYRRLWIRK